MKPHKIPYLQNTQRLIYLLGKEKARSILWHLSRLFVMNVRLNNHCTSNLHVLQKNVPVKTSRTICKYIFQSVLHMRYINRMMCQTVVYTYDIKWFIDVLVKKFDNCLFFYYECTFFIIYSYCKVKLFFISRIIIDSPTVPKIFSILALNNYILPRIYWVNEIFKVKTELLFFNLYILIRLLS